MFFDNRESIDNLKGVRKTDLHAIGTAFMQCPVIKAPAVTKSVTSTVKHDTRDNNQVQRGQRHPINSRRLRNAERARNQIIKSSNLDEFQVLTGDAGINNSFARLQRTTGDHICQHLVMNGAVQGQEFRIGEQRRLEKFRLNLLTKLVTPGLRKRLTFSQKPCPD